MQKHGFQAATRNAEEKRKAARSAGSLNDVQLETNEAENPLSSGVQLLKAVIQSYRREKDVPTLQPLTLAPVRGVE